MGRNKRGGGMGQKHYLAVDLGAGGGRVVVGACRGGAPALVEVHRFAHGVETRGGFSRWNWGLITREVRAGLGKAPAEFAATVYASLDKALGGAIGELALMTGYPFARLEVVGGGSRSSLLCRRLAEWTGLPVAAGPAEAKVVGNVPLQQQVLEG